jgi:hypothetical protein
MSANRTTISTQPVSVTIWTISSATISAVKISSHVRQGCGYPLYNTGQGYWR